ncbi:RNase MRP subunit [Parahypoxylon ruwenzoriense]
MMVPPPGPGTAAAAATVGSNTAKNGNGNGNDNCNDTPANEYEEALSALQPLRPILGGLNHRNRNQHRRAAWWGTFGMLRRHVERLVGELLNYAALVAKSKSKSINSDSKKKKNKRKRDNDGNNDDNDRDDGSSSSIPGEKQMRDHVGWLRDVLVPKCYIAFSQLAADNQFATLGVVLLGALAQVHVACVRLVGDAATLSLDDKEGSHMSRTLDNTSATTTVSTREPNVGSSSSSTARLPACSDTDKPGRAGGAVISRDEAAKAEKQKEKAPPKDKNTDTAGKEAVKPVKKKRKVKKGDEFDDLFKGLF